MAKINNSGLRMFLFCVFLGVGLASMATSILAEELLGMYLAKIKLQHVQQTNCQLEKLVTDYEILIGQIEIDPNIVRRLGTINLGAKPNEGNVAYPQATSQQLAAARQAITERIRTTNNIPEIPDWILRCVRPWLRGSLFIAGAGLIIVAFTCLSTPKLTE